ncbi:MAG: NfeD family protein [Bacteroidales bacterium]|nr:NfeD family protein [Bacteroidales bacterium]
MSALVIIGVLLVLGVIMMVIEIFLLPGFSIAGIMGIFFLLAGIIKAFMFSMEAGFLVSLIALLSMALAIYLFMRSKTLNRLSLQESIDSKVDPLKNIDVKVGDRAVTLSRLAPIGKIKVNDKVVEAKSVKDFIDDGVEVVVVAVDSTNVEVEPVA